MGIALMVCSNEDGEYGHIIIRPVLVENDIPVGVTGEKYDGLKNLEISCQVDCKQDVSYGWNVWYREPPTVGLYLAEVMFKTLRKINNSLNRMGEKRGRPLSYSQYVARIAEALKIRAFIWPTEHGYHVESIAGAVSYIDNLEQSLIKKLAGGVS